MSDPEDQTRSEASGLGDYFDGGDEPFATGVPISADATVSTPSPADDASMIRSQEQLHLSTVTEAAGRVRLRKFVVSEDVTTTVTVRREVVQLEREPVTEDELASLPARDDLTEGDLEVVLYAERVVVSKEVVPVERVHLARRVVTEEQRVDETVRSEQIQAEGYRLP